MLEVCRAAAVGGLPIFLLGGCGELLTALSVRLTEQIPDLQIAGVRPSKFRPLSLDEWTELVEAVRTSGARILFVGLGCPRQEVFAFEARHAVSMPTIAVGAAFTFLGGVLPQAPLLMQRWGLEWLFRLFQEPRRLWRRYLLLNPAYLALLALQKLRLHHIESHELEPPDTQLLYG
jgi:exopolysaccharide biosynthesis WecB/TagA/CpsF family protein